MDIVLYCLAIVIAAVITGLLGYFMVPFLHKIKFGQTIREVGPSWHKNKQGTPTMGGVIMLIAVIAVALLTIYSMRHETHTDALERMREITV